MKKKIIYILGIGLVLSSLTACGKTTTNSQKEETSIESQALEEDTDVKVSDSELEFTDDELEDFVDNPIEKEKFTTKDYALFAVLNIYMENFDRDYSLVGNAIDNKNENDYNYYMNRLQFTIDSVNDLYVPLEMKDSVKIFVSSLEKFKEASLYLHDAYTSNNYDDYNSFQKSLVEAGSYMQVFSSSIENMSDYIDFYSAMKETIYYSYNFNLFGRQSEFSEDENYTLFMIDRNVQEIASLADEAFIKYYKKTGYNTSLDSIDKDIEKLQNLEITDENLNNYRNEVVECLVIFSEYMRDYFEAADIDVLDSQISQAADISDNAKRLHNSISYMRDFYNSKGLNLDYYDASTTTEMQSSTEDLDITTDKNGEVVSIERAEDEKVIDEATKEISEEASDIEVIGND